MAPTSSQRYLSTRGGSSNFSFEQVVLKGLAEDGGLFIPEEIPTLPHEWALKWRTYSFEELAFEIFSLYISSSEISSRDLREIITRSYSTFRTQEISPLVLLDERRHLYLLELFHGPTYAFKDVALQFLGNLFQYFLVRANKGKACKERDHLTVIGATSGDTGSAAIYGLRGKADLSIFMLHPKGKVSEVQEAQMTTILDGNVHNVSVDGSFDDCQDFVKALFADSQINRTHKLGAVNSINSNDILHRFMTSGTYSVNPVHDAKAHNGLASDGAEASPSGVKETLSPAMDILVSSNFERLLAYLAFDFYSTTPNPSIEEKQQIGRSKVGTWLRELKTTGGFKVDAAILKAAQRDFLSERVDDEEILSTIRSAYSTFSPPVSHSEGTTGKTGGYILDPHSAIGVAASLRSIAAPSPPDYTIALATAHPAKFANAVDMALTGQEGYSFEDVLPQQFKDLKHMPRRVEAVGKDDTFRKVRSLIYDRVPPSGQ